MLLLAAVFGAMFAWRWGASYVEIASGATFGAFVAVIFVIEASDWWKKRGRTIRIIAGVTAGLLLSAIGHFSFMGSLLLVLFFSGWDG